MITVSADQTVHLLGKKLLCVNTVSSGSVKSKNLQKAFKRSDAFMVFVCHFKLESLKA